MNDRRRAAASRAPTSAKEPIPMNEETFNMSLRKFLKTVGVNSQREIEHAVAKALEDKRLQGTETLPATMTLNVAGLHLEVVFDGEIKLG
jgi:ribosomal protein L1